MEISDLINALENMRSQGCERVFVLDMTHDRVLDIVGVEGPDKDGDALISAD